MTHGTMRRASWYAYLDAKRASTARVHRWESTKTLIGALNYAVRQGIVFG